VTATWSGIASPTGTDWVGVYTPAGNNGDYLAWAYVNCSHSAGSAAAAGNCAISLAGLSAGTYQLRLLANDGMTDLATSNPFAIGGSVAISASPSSTTPSGSVTAMWSGIASPTSTDWIGAFTPGSDDTDYVAWAYVSCSHSASAAAASGSCAFAASDLGSGPYEFRLFANDGFSVLATSGSFNITSSAVVSASPNPVASGGSVTATWSGIASPTGTDWVGVYTPASANTAYLRWAYVNCSQTSGAAAAAGNCAISLSGLSAGTYQLRLLANDGYAVLATSGNFTLN
jgi:hypothetical protein